MRTFPRLLCVLLLVAFGATVGLGWGNMTHVYLAKHLGVKVGAHNLNEMYGALLTDMVNFDFSAEGEALANAFHYNTDLSWAFYGAAKSTPGKAAFYGMFTHNGTWGADLTAHGTSDNGWVITQAASLEGPIAVYLVGLIMAANPTLDQATAETYAAGLAHAMAHDVIEQAVDILVKREKDPFVGERLVLAATARSPEVPKVLKSVLGALFTPAVGEAVAAGEAEYRDAMKEYGQVFTLPEEEMIGTMCYISAGIAHDFIMAKTGLSLTIDPAKVGEFLMMAIATVEDVYDAELQATMMAVAANMQTYGPPPAGPVFAFAGNGGLEEEMFTESPVEVAPREFALAQNYPNPFNPSTRIAFALPAAGQVTLSVYNLLGQEVATLVNETRSAGRHEAIWNASGMPSGIYFCRLQSGTFIETKRMTLLK